jgi:NDP-sugar pyrophosphorylase family protein
VPFREGTEYGAVEMDGERRLMRIAGRPGPDSGQPRYHFTGIHVIDPSVLEEIPPGVKHEINREVYPRLIAAGAKVMGYVHAGFWRELGTPTRYLDGSIDLLRRGDSDCLRALSLREGVYSASPSSQLRGVSESPFLAGTGVIMEEDSFAAGAILGDGVKLSRRSSLTRSILWEGVELGAQSSLDECIASTGARIPPGARIRRKIILDDSSYGGDRKGMERMGNLLVTPF